MKTEKQHKESQQAETIQSKRERSKFNFADNRSLMALQTQLIHSIQKGEDKIVFSDNMNICPPIVQLNKVENSCSDRIIQKVGGRDEDWSKLDKKIIKEVFNTLSVDLVKYYNDILKIEIEKLNKAQFRKANPIKSSDYFVKLSGSSIIMDINPSMFIADDIDLDFYSYGVANTIDSINDDPNYIVWSRLFSNFYHGIYSFENKMFKAVKCKNIDCEQGISQMSLKINFPKNINDYFVIVELKNITSKMWHKGWKEGKKRNMGEINDIQTPKEQLYIDICLRINDIISVLLTSKEPLRSLPENLIESIDNKSYRAKKMLLEQSLIKENKYMDTVREAETNLDELTFRKWYLISKEMNFNLKFFNKYIRLFN